MAADITLERIESAAALVYRTLSPTPQIAWPLLAERCGCEVWVKHENHLPTGAFKVRGGLVYFDWLKTEHPEVRGVIAATRGNHGQSVACAAAVSGLSATLVVPHGNNPEKNRAMRGYGATLIEHGRDFAESLDFAGRMAAEQGLHFVPSFDWRLVRGVATYALEFFRGAPPLDRIYVPIGLGSGISGVIAVRNVLRLETEIIGVVAARAPTYADSLAAGKPVPSREIPDTIADGVACRIPDERALAGMPGQVSRIVKVEEGEIESAILHYLSDCHQLAEGAGAVPLAAASRQEEKERNSGKRIGLVLSGGNIDREALKALLAGRGGIP